MRVYRDTVFNGPDSDAWQDFVMACIEELGVPPWSEAAQDNDAPADFADYWRAVAVPTASQRMKCSKCGSQRIETKPDYFADNAHVQGIGR